MNDDKELLVEIDEAEEKSSDTSKVDPKTETTATGASDDSAIEVVRAQVKEFEAKLQAERKEKEEARRRAEMAERQAREAQSKVAQSELDVVSTSIVAVESERDAVKRELKDAMERGDVDATVAANERLAEVTTTLKQLKEGKENLERTRSEPVNNSADPVEAYISKFSPRSQEYLRQHKDLVTDTSKNKRLIAAHYDAEAEGLAPDTDQYFAFIDQKLGYTSETGQETGQKQSSRRATPAAPVSRGGDLSSGGGSASQNVVKLSPGEARAAVDGSIVWNSGPNKGEPIGVKEYARRKAMMQKSGAYDNPY